MKITNHKNNGVCIKFDNGIRLSTIWGYCSYCENYDYEHSSGDYLKNFDKIEKGSKDVEIMFLNGDKKFIEKICKKYAGDKKENLIGYLTLYQWFEIINKCYKYENKLKKI